MDKVSLTELAEQYLDLALEASSGRSATTIHGGREHHLRQTLIAMRAGVVLAEHSNPGEATLQLLQGQVALRWGAEFWDVRAGDLVTIPDATHSVEANADSVLLLTVAKQMGFAD